MQEYIESMYQVIKSSEAKELNPFALKAILYCIEKAKAKLEKEKQQIIDAYYGKIDGVFGYREEGQEYYNQTYNQNK